ncbi:hypothetical protein FB451DRAFT_1193599 [Mycena latifolia]|nr:hypothetical protein FB451DRAFT_1193599 [Mycena latifolia]
MLQLRLLLLLMHLAHAWNQIILRDCPGCRTGDRLAPNLPGFAARGRFRDNNRRTRTAMRSNGPQKLVNCSAGAVLPPGRAERGPHFRVQLRLPRRVNLQVQSEGFGCEDKQGTGMLRTYGAVILNIIHPKFRTPPFSKSLRRSTERHSVYPSPQALPLRQRRRLGRRAPLSRSPWSLRLRLQAPSSFKPCKDSINSISPCNGIFNIAQAVILVRVQARHLSHQAILDLEPYSISISLTARDRLHPARLQFVQLKFKVHSNRRDSLVLQLNLHQYNCAGTNALVSQELAIELPAQVEFEPTLFNIFIEMPNSRDRSLVVRMQETLVAGGSSGFNTELPIGSGPWTVLHPAPIEAWVPHTARSDYVAIDRPPSEKYSVSSAAAHPDLRKYCPVRWFPLSAHTGYEPGGPADLGVRPIIVSLFRQELVVFVFNIRCVIGGQ